MWKVHENYYNVVSRCCPNITVSASMTCSSLHYVLTHVDLDVETISKFAQMEFKHGEPERGRTIFEGLLSSYPKRIDIWSVYVDMEIKAGDQEIIRRLFERLTSMKVSSKKMKFFFKKWLQYEKEHGTEEDAERVKEKALDYVNSADRA